MRDPFEVIADVGDVVDAAAHHVAVDIAPLRDRLVDGTEVVEQMARWRPDIATSCAVVRGVFERLSDVLDMLGRDDLPGARDTFATVFDPEPAARPRLRVIHGTGGREAAAHLTGLLEPEIS